MLFQTIFAWCVSNNKNVYIQYLVHTTRFCDNFHQQKEMWKY
jgi:hypothetical protein